MQKNAQRSGDRRGKKPVEQFAARKRRFGKRRPREDGPTLKEYGNTAPSKHKGAQGKISG